MARDGGPPRLDHDGSQNYLHIPPAARPYITRVRGLFLWIFLIKYVTQFASMKFCARRPDNGGRVFVFRYSNRRDTKRDRDVFQNGMFASKTRASYPGEFAVIRC
jgi:hypothetical protein